MATKNKQDHQRYIIRCDRAGVFYARIKERRPEHNSLVLADARKIWYWRGAYSVEDIAANGIAAVSQVTRTIPEMEVYSPVQIIPCTATATARIDAIREWAK